MKKMITKKEDNSKFNRINYLYEKLSNTATGYTINDLAKELDVSTKTIQRDLHEVLSEYGAEKSGRYWKINPKKSEDNLSNNERIILGILDGMAKNAGKSFYNKAHSLISQVSQQLEHPIFTSISSEKLDEEDMIVFENVEEAVKNRNEITFEYEKYKFKVKPLKLAFFDGYWYVLALDKRDKDEFKKFHLKTIKNLKVTQTEFELESSIEDRIKKANSIWFKLTEPFSVRLLLSKEIRKYFERKPLMNQMIMGEDKDGSLEIEIKITHEMEIIPIILYYIPYIKVLSPDSIANVIKSRVEEYLSEI